MKFRRSHFLQILSKIFPNYFFHLTKKTSKFQTFFHISGAFRRGKSFMLDFLLRFLNHNGSEDWLGEEQNDVPLTGFHWRGGADRDTTGILIWSKVFEVKLPCGKDVAVVLMDTQGAFDSNA